MEPIPMSYRCSFCGKLPEEVRSTIAGPSVQICDECITRCLDILKDSGEIIFYEITWG